MKFIELLKDYTKQLKIDDTFNEDGSIDITYGGEITLNFHLKGKHHAIATAMLDTEGKLAQGYDLQYFMRIHLSRAKTDDAILAIDPDSNELVLYDVIDISDIMLRQFEERVGLFLNSVRFWRERTKGDDGSSNSPENMMRFFP